MKVIKNYIYNALYQIFALIVPLITTPYISRVLGPHNVGINTLTYSVTQYFVMFATLGLTMYGQREIAYIRQNRFSMSQAFWEIELLSIVTTFLSLCFFYLFMVRSGQYRIYYFAQSFLILASAFDVSWLFMGIEKFQVTVLRNFLVKVASIIMIFLFVKNQSDLFVYILIISGTTLLGNVSLWPYLKEVIVEVPIKKLNFLRHLKPTFELFIPQIAISIYSILNKVMLAKMVSVTEAGYFDSSDKIIRMCLTLVTAFTTVMMPHVANAFSNKRMADVKKYLNAGLTFAISVSLPIIVFIIAIANDFVPWFFGVKFLRVIPIMKIEVLAIFPIACAGILGAQYLVPLNRNRAYTMSILAGSAINILLNIPLINKFHGNGAAIVTIIAESCVTLVQLFFVWQDIDKILFAKNFAKSLLASFILFLLITLELKFFSWSIITLGIIVVSGILVYFGSLLILNLDNLSIIMDFIGKKNG